MSNVSGFNDKRDREQFKGIESNCYSLCFSTGINENLPLWYFYSGIDGKGGRIRFTKPMVSRLVKKGVYSLCELDEENNRKGNVILQLNSDNADITFKDVLYNHYNKNEISFKYNTMTNYKFSRNEYDKVAENWKYFLKGAIWYYEKETRLLVRLKGEAEKAVKKYKKCVVALSFPDKLNYSVVLAPNIENFDELTQYEHIGGNNNGKKVVSFSEYKGEINMNLCGKCPKNKNT